MQVRSKKRPNKYNSLSCTRDGYHFASIGEMECYSFLTLLQKGKEISSLIMQPRVVLMPGVIYKPDFMYFCNKSKKKMYVEFKGFETDRWKLIKKLWRVVGPEDLIVYKKDRRKSSQLYSLYIDDLIKSQKMTLVMSSGEDIKSKE